MSDLFRKEVIENKQNHAWNGDVALPNTFSLKLLSIILLIMLISIFLFFTYGSYTERRTVTGYLTPISGVVKVSSPTTGVIESINVNNNELVNVDDDLLVITSNQYSEQGKYSDNTKKNLEEQLEILNNQINLSKENAQQQQNSILVNLEGLNKKIYLIEDMISNQKNKIILAKSTYDSYISANLRADGAVSQIEIKGIEDQIINFENELSSLKQDKENTQNQIKNQNVELQRIKTQADRDLSDLNYKKISINQSLLDNLMVR